MATTLLATAAKSIAGTDSGVSRAVHALPHIRTNVSSNERWISLAAGRRRCRFWGSMARSLDPVEPAGRLSDLPGRDRELPDVSGPGC